MSDDWADALDSTQPCAIAILHLAARLEEATKSGQKVDAAAVSSLKRPINSRGNSMRLHELYFDGLATAAADRRPLSAGGDRDTVRIVE